MKRNHKILGKPLTEKHLEVANLMMKGLTTKQVSDALGITTITVNYHRDQIYKRLGVNSVVQMMNKLLDISPNKVQRSIEFKEEHLQAGISILSYFSTVLKQKEPDVNAKVKIEQEGLTVKLIINSEENELEIIERTLEEYGAVVTGNESVQNFLSNQNHVHQLETKLEIAKMEIQLTNRQLEFEKTQFDKQLNSAEDQVKWLRNTIGDLMIDKENRLKDLLTFLKDSESNRSDEIKTSLGIIRDAVLTQSVLQEDHNEELVKALEKISKNDKSLFEQLKSFAGRTASTATGRLLFELVSNYVTGK